MEKRKPHIIVDGWNLVHFDKVLEKLLTEGSQSAASARLLERLESVSQFEGARLTIVYDGIGSDISIVRPTQSLELSEVYTPSGMTADELIESLCASSKNPSEITVVSRDNLLRLTASSFGATAVKPDKLFDRADSANRAVREVISKNARDGAGLWKSANPFDKLDLLMLDIEGAVNASPLLSKRLKRKMKHGVSKASAIPEFGSQKVAAGENAIVEKSGQRTDKPKFSFKLGMGAPSERALEDLKVRFGMSAKNIKKKRRNT